MGYSRFLLLAAALTLFAAGRDAALAGQPQGCVMHRWAGLLAPGPQRPLLVEALRAKGGIIRAYRFDGLTGPHAKLFIFLFDDGQCFRRVFSVGSYETAAALGAGDGRLFHSDLYHPDAHFIVGFHVGPPEYREIRSRALDLLQ